jgi:hypothetical protein
MRINWQWLLLGLSLATMFGLWFGLWLHRAGSGKRNLPTHWPLHARVLVNAEELRVWRWLAKTFDDHHVMVKMPVTRFTRPNANEDGRRLYELLKNTNCTFSVCTNDGHVVGCVDVPKPFGLSRKNKILKENLLTQCGISYTVLTPGRLPNAAEIRNRFLGEVASKARHLKREEAAVEAARINLKKTLMQQRGMRGLKAADDKRAGSSSMPSHWHDSFLIQANSRPAELRTASGYRPV